jgi:hypothetical protein
LDKIKKGKRAKDYKSIAIGPSNGHENKSEKWK